MFFCRTDGILKKRECVSKLKSAYYWFLLGTDYTENTDELEKSREIRVVRA